MLKINRSESINLVRKDTLPELKPQIEFKEVLNEKIKNYFEDWSKVDTKLKNKLQALDPSIRSLIELQDNFQQINIKTQVATQATEAVTGTVKKLQNISGN